MVHYTVRMRGVKGWFIILLGEGSQRVVHYPVRVRGVKGWLIILLG